MAFEHLSCETLLSWIQDNERITLVDIRDKQSYASGHIPGAQHLGNHNVEAFILESDMQLPVIVCCYHGNSSQGAADYLNQQGFINSYSLDGGYERWQQLAANSSLSRE